LYSFSLVAVLACHGVARSAEREDGSPVLVHRSPIIVIILVPILVDNDYDNDYDNDLNPEP
jgi:hypothetical protein